MFEDLRNWQSFNFEDIRRWHIQQVVDKVIKALEGNGFKAYFARSRDEALKIVLDLIPQNAVVGVGGSVTIREIGVLDALLKRGNKVVHHWIENLSWEESFQIRRQELISDVFLCSTNALTLDGVLVNVDHGGNRVAAMIFGPRKTIIVLGVNKIVKDLDEALWRIRNIATSTTCKRLGLKTPCATTGLCQGCKYPVKACSAITIIEDKPTFADIHVIIVGESLGF
ncbi:MAG: lactate utilization protein [Candidatus Methanomethylicia archaeon]